MWARMGLAASKSASSPPTIKVRVPALAPATPPETGASIQRMPRAFAASPTWRADATSMVEQSTTRAPAGKAASRSCPPLPASQSARTCSPAGSMLMTTSQSATASRASPAAIQPAAIALATLSGIKSNTRTPCPALARLAAMGPPMLPSPINPILVISFAPCRAGSPATCVRSSALMPSRRMLKAPEGFSLRASDRRHPASQCRLAAPASGGTCPCR